MKIKWRGREIEGVTASWSTRALTSVRFRLGVDANLYIEVRRGIGEVYYDASIESTRGKLTGAQTMSATQAVRQLEQFVDSLAKERP